ncbi:hypothetical protein SS37A_20270 [Methylocystis iwaonis]|uniref:Uncharacterized protein n=1 Tax=Methylocystis iwaonis TaxID=2885079 RepID=A0ABN6VFS4_9HYPH|nr:hypothetical protein SS37A_20270 [Methylocystis iwaonis]
MLARANRRDAAALMPPVILFPIELLASGNVIPPGGLKARPGIQSRKSADAALDSRSLAARASGMTRDPLDWFGAIPDARAV